ncbi:hypothetical protein J7L60_06535 [Candidatus Bathyarchaeota archaeon]|nr:hypothetical protein [Candidatus Bathyarchaeota archaeon]
MVPEERTFCLISVSGHPASLKPAAYDLNGKISYSRLASIPLLYRKIREHPGARFKFILLIPHSLLTFSEGSLKFIEERLGLGDLYPQKGDEGSDLGQPDGLREAVREGRGDL